MTPLTIPLITKYHRSITNVLNYQPGDYFALEFFLHSLFSHVGYLERNEYIELEPEDLEEARELLLEEVLHGKTK